MTQEFDISVTPVGDDEFLVRTEKVASGVPLAEEQVQWPIAEWLHATHELMNDPLLGILEGRRPISNQDGTTSTLNLSLVQLGQQLYQGLFQGTLRESWTCAQAIAQNRGELLQLRLGVKGKYLSSLPWEVLHAGDRPIATGTEVLFSRYQPHSGTSIRIHPLQQNQPLKILMAIAAPNDHDGLQLKREVNHLKEELHRTRHPPEIQLTILEQPDREHLTQALEQGQYQVFHYAGHSNLATAGGELYLVNRRTGLTEILSGEDLAGLLVNNGVQVAVLNSCRGAYRHPTKANSETSEVNLTEMLVKRGIPGVLAMAERIPDEVALTLTQLLYRNLNQGYRVDLSLSRARQGLISAYGSHQLYWALPVLYLHREFSGCLTSRVPDVSESQLLLSSDLFLEEQLLQEADESLEWMSPLNEWTEEEVLFPEEILDEIQLEEEESSETDEGDIDFIGEVLSQIQSSPSQPQPQPQPQPPENNSTLEDPLPLIRNHFSTQCPQLPAVLSRLKPLWNQVKSRVEKPSLKCLLIASLIVTPVSVWCAHQNQGASVSPTDSITTVTKTLAADLESLGKDQVLKVAQEEFQQKNLEAGVEATVELLSRGAWIEARSALKTVPLQYRNRPEIHFLRGRFMWQSIEYGNTEYRIQQVREAWEKAVQQRPESIKYQNALGFAYYLEENIEQAYQTWSTIAFDDWTSFNKQAAITAQQDLFNTYAGLGLVLMKSAQDLPTDQQALRLSKAVKFRDKVLAEQPELFKPRTLAQNWLWSNPLVQDWQMLLKIADKN